MAKIYQAEVTKELAKNANIQQNRDKTPDELAEKIVPTFETNLHQVKPATILFSYSRNTSATGVGLSTMNKSEDYYITGLYVQSYSTAAADNTLIRLRVYIDGVDTSIYNYTKPTTTETTTEQYLNFDKPIKVDYTSGGLISLDNTFTAGASTTNIIVFGYKLNRN